MRATYANCFLPEGSAEAASELLLTEERSVAERAPAEATAMLVDRLVDPAVAQAANIAAWDLAFRWARIGGDDATDVDGVSAADLGGAEAGVGVILPAFRGALGMLAAIDAGARFDALHTAVASDGNWVYERTESIQCAAAAAAAQARFGGAVSLSGGAVAAGGNDGFFGKYRRTRDVDPLGLAEPWSVRLTRPLAIRGANALATLRHRSSGPTLLVYEYNPTQAFAEQYAEQEPRSWRLARHRTHRSAFAPTIRHGDRLSAPLPYPRRPEAPEFRDRLAAALREREADLQTAFTVGGVPLWPVVGPRLIDVAERYAAFAASAVPAARRRLRRLRADAVLVPFDTPPEARTLVRVAQSMGVPTHVLNDGYKGDDFSPEGMTADVALSWSSSIAARYYGRRADRRTVVTGNPRADLPAEPARAGDAQRRGVLVGSFTFSAVDLNCRRSDPEAFLETILEAVAASSWASDQPVTVKLHPADNAGHYEHILKRFADLDVRLVTEGDVVDLFTSHRIYVTTYSTSILEAVRAGVPIAFFHSNNQVLHPPFSDDEILGALTAADAETLTTLIDAASADPADAPDPQTDRWIEMYLGPADRRSADRIIAAIDATLAGR